MANFTFTIENSGETFELKRGYTLLNNLLFYNIITDYIVSITKLVSALKFKENKIAKECFDHIMIYFLKSLYYLKIISS